MSSETSTNILNAARTLFGRYGYKGVSVRQICQAANCNVASVSYHYQGKDELYRKCFDDGMHVNTQFTDILTPAKNRDDLIAKLTLFSQQLYSHMVQQSDVLRMVIHEMHDPTPVGEDIMTKIQESLPDLVTRFLDDAQTNGILRADLETKLLVSFLFDICCSQIIFEKYIVMKHKGASITDIDYRKKLVDQLMLVFNDGVYVS